LRLENLSSQHHTAQVLSDTIFEVIDQIGSDKFVAIVSDNASNVAAARRIVVQKHKNILRAFRSCQVNTSDSSNIIYIFILT